MILYQLLASLRKLRGGFLFAVELPKDKKLLKVFNSPGTPQWTAPLKKFLQLFGPKMPIVLQFFILLLAYVFGL